MVQKGSKSNQHRPWNITPKEPLPIFGPSLYLFEIEGSIQQLADRTNLKECIKQWCSTIYIYIFFICTSATLDLGLNSRVQCSSCNDFEAIVVEVCVQKRRQGVEDPRISMEGMLLMFCVTVSVLGQQQYCRVSGKPGFYLFFWSVHGGARLRYN